MTQAIATNNRDSIKNEETRRPTSPNLEAETVTLEVPAVTASRLQRRWNHPARQLEFLDLRAYN